MPLHTNGPGQVPASGNTRQRPNVSLFKVGPYHVRHFWFIRISDQGFIHKYSVWGIDLLCYLTRQNVRKCPLFKCVRICFLSAGNWTHNLTINSSKNSLLTFLIDSKMFCSSWHVVILDDITKTCESCCSFQKCAHLLRVSNGSGTAFLL